MIHADTIHKWLSDPSSLGSSDRNEVKDVLGRYPYFIPARYLQAFIIQKEDVFTDVMLGTMHLYMGNWLLFHEKLRRSKGEEPVAPAIEKAPQITEEKQPQQDTFATPGTETLHETGDALTDHVNEEIKLENEGATVPDETTATQMTEQVNEINKEEPLIQPVYTEDYFRYEGIEVSEDIPGPEELETENEAKQQEDKSLLVMMSFSEWLQHFKTKAEKAKEEEEDKKALKTMWQKEKLAAALEEENDEIPESVFEMAVNSIEREEDLASDSLAEILVKQKKYDKAIDMYRKLSLRNPQKSTYFASQIEKVQKLKES